MADTGAQNSLQAAPGSEPGAPAGAGLFNPFGTLGVVAPVQAAAHAPPPEATGLGAIVVVLVAAAAVVRLLRSLLE